MEIASNYLYFLHYFDSHFLKNNSLSLDYGCGKGDFIKYANANGYDFRGVDNYYDSTNITAFENSPVRAQIDIIDSSCVLPFTDKSFDFISSIQVFEHVENLENVLIQLRRVLKDNGKILCSFQFKYSCRESHRGIPFSHWFKPSSRYRKPWVYVLYKLGFGYGKKKNLLFKDWYKEAFNYLDKYCYYRSKSEFMSCCKRVGLAVRSDGKHKLQFQLNQEKKLLFRVMSGIVSLTPAWLVSFILQIRSTVCYELTKQ